MSDWFSTAVEMQREILRAQRAQIDAAEQMLDGARKFASLQESGQKAAEANLKLWRQWAQLWGWK
ncbi:MAG: hypothetical protein ACOY45_16080 [Pseudomonadota bacterium]